MIVVLSGAAISDAYVIQAEPTADYAYIYCAAYYKPHPQHEYIAACFNSHLIVGAKFSSYDIRC